MNACDLLITVVLCAREECEERVLIKQTGSIDMHSIVWLLCRYILNANGCTRELINMDAETPHKADVENVNRMLMYRFVQHTLTFIFIVFLNLK